MQLLSHFLSDPPSAPSIVGYEEGVPIKAGEFQKLTCVANGGNPLATLRWFKRDREVRTTYCEDAFTYSSLTHSKSDRTHEIYLYLHLCTYLHFFSNISHTQ